jgi:succinate dehydrogenase / fumarate reductase cytochrome b subunit
MRLPITAWVSIAHRLSGLVLVAAFAAFLYMLHFSLASPSDFGRIIQVLHRPECKFGIWILLSALAYHTCMGLRHMVMDMGMGESLKGGILGAQLALAGSAVLIGLATVWVMSW